MIAGSAVTEHYKARIGKAERLGKAGDLLLRQTGCNIGQWYDEMVQGVNVQCRSSTID